MERRGRAQQHRVSKAPTPFIAASRVHTLLPYHFIPFSVLNRPPSLHPHRTRPSTSRGCSRCRPQAAFFMAPSGIASKSPTTLLKTWQVRALRYDYSHSTAAVLFDYMKSGQTAQATPLPPLSAARSRCQLAALHRHALPPCPFSNHFKRKLPPTPYPPVHQIISMDFTRNPPIFMKSFGVVVVGQSRPPPKEL